MTSEATVRNRLYSRHLNVAVFLVLSAVCGLRSASAQHTQSQRRLSPGEGPQGPIEQMRLLMHLQHLQSQFQPTDASTEQSGKNSLAERLHNRKGMPKTKDATPDNTLPAPQDTSQIENDLQRLKEQLGQLLPDRPQPAVEPLSQHEIPRGDTTEKGRRSQNLNRTRNGAINRSRPDPPGVSSYLTAPSEQSFQPDSKLLEEITKKYPALLNSPQFAEKIMELQERHFNEPSNTTEQSGSAFDISKELSKSGLAKTFTRLVRDIQTKVQTEQGTEFKLSDGSANENSTLNPTLFRVLDSVREDVVETIHKSRKDRTSNIRQKSAGTEDSPDQSTAPNNNSESLSTSVPNQEQPPLEASTEHSPLTPLSNLPGWGSSLNDNASTQLFVIFFGLGTATVLYFLITPKSLLSQSHRQRFVAVQPENLHTREDVIRAFHWLTHCQSPDAADWWNHLQATESLSQHSAGREESLRQLMTLYEAARYQSANRTFDQTHIQQARTALAECLS